MDKQKLINNISKRPALDVRLALVCVCFAAGALLCVPTFDALNGFISRVGDALYANAWAFAVITCVFMISAAILMVFASYARVSIAVFTAAAGVMICFASHFFVQTKVFSLDYLRFAAFCFIYVLAALYVSYSSLLISERLKALVRSDHKLRRGVTAFSVFSALLTVAVVAAGLFCLKII